MEALFIGGMQTGLETSVLLHHLLLVSQPAAYQATFSPRVVDVLNEWGYIYILLKDGKVSMISYMGVCVRVYMYVPLYVEIDSVNHKSGGV